MTAHRRLLSTSLTSGESQDLRVVGGHGAWFQLADGREVIDASAFPALTTVNPMVAVLMLAERGAELVRDR